MWVTLYMATEQGNDQAGEHQPDQGGPWDTHSTGTVDILIVGAGISGIGRYLRTEHRSKTLGVVRFEGS